MAAKTTDGYLLRLFCIGFTKRNSRQEKKTTYAQTSKVRLIRAKMAEIMKKEVTFSEASHFSINFEMKTFLAGA